MSVFKRTNSFLGRYSRIIPFSKVLSPICSAAYHITAVLLALLAIIAVVMVFVNVPAEQMLLPPRMSAIKNDAGELISYSLKLGNGIKIICPESTVTLSHIKTVFFCRIAIYALVLAVSVPVFRLLTMLFKSVAADDIMNEKNAKYINYIGLIVIAGNILVSILANLFNYILINKFLGNTVDIGFVFDTDWMGAIVGIFIITIGTLYGYACSKHAVMTSVAVYDNPGETNER